MDKISPTLLNDTLKMVQLARETANLQGSKTQAEKFDPIVNQLMDLVNIESNPIKTSTDGILNQSDFKTMFGVAQNNTSTQAATSTSSINERNQIVGSMSSGGMSDLEIARQLGMTRDEVTMIVNLANLNNMR